MFFYPFSFKEGMASEEKWQKDLKSAATRRRAFEEIVCEYTEPLYMQIRRMVRFHDDADDVLQNTFMKAWAALDSFRGECRISTWLYRIAINESLRFLARQKEMLSLSEAMPDVEKTLESDPYFDGDEAALLLQKALETLPEKQRIVFNMKYFDEMKYEEMSEILRTSVGALKASYHIAVKKIETFFEESD